MAFPPEFSDSLEYANRYDLDEIDVFLEGNSTEPMFFSVNGLPKQLSFGKHYFYLSMLSSKNQMYKLRAESRILFEFKSVNNIVLRSDVTPLKQKNGVAVCFVDVLQDPLRTYKEILDGEGTLTVVGSLQNKKGVGQAIPEKFQNAMNYRCVFPIEIRKNLINADSPKALQSEHKIQTSLGRFSFVKASISPKANSITGIEYAGDGTAASAVGGGATGVPGGGS